MNTSWYTSSSGNGLSATIFGFSVLGIAQGLSMFLTVIGHPVDQNYIEQLITGVIAVIGAIITVVGLIRKGVNAVKTKTA